MQAPCPFRKALVAASSSIGRKHLLLDALQSSKEDVADLLGGVVVRGAIGVECRIPMDRGPVRISFVLLNPELCLVILHRKWALDDLIAVALIVGFDELLFDAAAILERKGADLGSALLGLLAIRDERVPVLDGAETSGDVPHLRR